MPPFHFYSKIPLDIWIQPIQVDWSSLWYIIWHNCHCYKSWWRHWAKVLKPLKTIPKKIPHQVAQKIWFSIREV